MAKSKEVQVRSALKHKRLILDTLYRAKRWITTNEVAERSNMTWATADKYLKELKKSGLVISGKTERGASWVYWRLR